MRLFTRSLLTLCLAQAILFSATKLRAQTNAPAPELPRTVEQGYATLVPESVQTERKNAEIIGQIQNLQEAINQLQGKTADKATVEKLGKQVNLIFQYETALQQAVVSLQKELTKIETILDSYGQGYKAAQAADLNQRQKANKPNASNTSNDPLNP
jgi:TolA-binding protein